MPTLYLTEQGSVLRKEGQRLVVEKDRQTLLQVPAFQVEQVLVFGHVQVTTPALEFLLAEGIEVSFLSRYGRLKGRLVAVESKNVPLRLAQYRRAQEEEFCLALSRAFVRGKIRNARSLLMKQDRSHDDLSLEAEAQALQLALEDVDAQPSREALRGVEGRAAAVYFRAFGKMLRRAVDFQGRSQHPPQDPVNALLSFGYTLLGNELLAVLSGVGFDPYLGFLHTVRYGRPSLVQDLLEEFRAPVADRLALSLVNLAVLEAGDFEATPEGGFVLKPEALKRYLEQYEVHLNAPFKHPESGQRTSFRKLLTIQTRQLARVVQEGGEYEPFWSK